MARNEMEVEIRLYAKKSTNDLLQGQSEEKKDDIVIEQELELLLKGIIIALHPSHSSNALNPHTHSQHQYMYLQDGSFRFSVAIAIRSILRADILERQRQRHTPSKWNSTFD